MLDVNSVFIFLVKMVEVVVGVWFDNYVKWFVIKLFLVLGVVGVVLVVLLVLVCSVCLVFIVSGLLVIGIIFIVGMLLFFFVMFFLLDVKSSLILWDLVFSYKILGLMFWMVLIFLLFIIVYIGWVYWVVKGKVIVCDIYENEYMVY